MFSKFLNEKSLVLLALGVAVGATAVYASSQLGESKEKKVKEEKESSPLKDPDIELPNLRHSKGETQAPLVSN